jgi:hypothetical protein
MRAPPTTSGSTAGWWRRAGALSRSQSSTSCTCTLPRLRRLPWFVGCLRSVVWRNDTANFPYSCYHLYCSPPGAKQYPGFPTGTCDPYSNPNPQEVQIVLLSRHRCQQHGASAPRHTSPSLTPHPPPRQLQQVLPCEEWAPHGFPSQPGQGWVGDDRLWQLDAGGLAARLFLTGTEPTPLPGLAAHRPPAPGAQTEAAWPGLGRSWVSFEVGPEQLGLGPDMVRWEVSEWDVLQ